MAFASESPAHHAECPNLPFYRATLVIWYQVIISLNTRRVDPVDGDVSHDVSRTPIIAAFLDSTPRERYLSHHVLSYRCVRDARVHDIIARHVTAFDARARRHRASSTTAFEKRRPGRQCVELTPRTRGVVARANARRARANRRWWT